MLRYCARFRSPLITDPGPVIPIAGPNRDFAGLAIGRDSIAIPFDFLNPVREVGGLATSIGTQGGIHFGIGSRLALLA